MSIRKVWATRVNNATAELFVGQKGTIFFNEPDAANIGLRVSDGETPGGLPISMPIATETTIGGIKLGPGVTLNPDNQIIIDSAGLEFSFGDFASITGQYDDSTSYAVLKTINTDEDMYLISNGAGDVNVIGEFNVYKTDGDVAGAIAIPPIFRVKADGQVQMLVPGSDSTQGAVSIVGGLDGVYQPPVNTGVMLHITGIAGTPGIPSRLYNDAQNAFAAFVARRYNGTAAAPSAVLANEELMRISGTAHNGTLIPGSANQRITFKALGNQTLTNQGGSIEFAATPLNSTTLTTVATVNSTGLTINSGKITLAAGTTTSAPLAFTSGTNLTVPVTGSIEYDGKVFYGTPLGSERGIISAQQWYNLNSNRTLTYTTMAAQSIFAVSPNLSANTRYYFRLKLIVDRSAGTNGTALTLGWTGSATITRISQTIESKTGTLGTVGAQNMIENIITTNFSTQLPVTITSNAPSQHTLVITGFINIGANGGTITPNISWEGAIAPGTVTVYTGSSFELFPISETGVNTQVGNWT